MQHIVLVLLCFLASTLHAQDKDDSGVKKTVERYMHAIEARDWSTCLDLAHPAMFTVADKETMVQALSESMDKPGSTVKGGHIVRSSGPVSDGDRKFALVHYALAMEPIVPKENDDNGDPLPADEQAASDQFMIELMRTMYGEENVQWNAGARQLKMNVEEPMYVILEPGIGAWRVLKANGGAKGLEVDVVPEHVRKQLNG